MPYIKDKRTSTTVALGVFVGDGELTIVPIIHGTYLPSDVNQSISFGCVSKGPIERVFAETVRQQRE